MRLLLLLSILLYNNLLLAQEKDTADNIQDFETIIETSLRKDPKPFFKLDSRNSFISSQKAHISGFKLGFDFNNTVRIGGGFNHLTTVINRSYTHLEGPGMVTNSLLQFNYFSLYGEYVFYRDKKWQFTIPVQFGLGSSFYQYRDLRNNQLVKIDERPILLYEPTITGQYKFFSWLGVGGGIGYRLMLINNKSINHKFTSPIYEIGLRWFIWDLVKKIIRKDDPEKESSLQYDHVPAFRSTGS